MVGYEVFKSSAEFVKWQEDNAPVDIFSIQPLVTGLDMDVEAKTNKKCEAGGSTRISIFVTYKI